MTIDDLLSPNMVALHYRQKLEPVDGRDLAIFPPTYPAPSQQGANRHDTPYVINELSDGSRIVSLDSVPSQANRMEACFASIYADCVPRVGVEAGGKTVMVTQLSHRLADAAIRATDLEEDIRSAFEDYAQGNAVSVAKICPTALVFGAWDSRDTRVKIPRLIRSEIVAHDVDVLTRSAQFSRTFNQEDLGLTDGEWKKGADAGFAPTPIVDDHGGVRVRGDIFHSAVVHLGGIRHLEPKELSAYVLGIALVGLIYGARDYALRAGCWLVPEGDAETRVVLRNGERSEVLIGDIDEYLREAANKARDELGIPIGDPPRVAAFDVKRARRALNKKSKAED